MGYSIFLEYIKSIPIYYHLSIQWIFSNIKNSRVTEYILSETAWPIIIMYFFFARMNFSFHYSQRRHRFFGIENNLCVNLGHNQSHSKFQPKLFSICGVKEYFSRVNIFCLHYFQRNHRLNKSIQDKSTRFIILWYNLSSLIYFSQIGCCGVKKFICVNFCFSLFPQKTWIFRD